MTILIATISILLFLLAHVALWGHPKRIWGVLLFLLYSISSYIGYLFFFISDYFTGMGVTEGVLYHLFHGQITQSSSIITAYTPLISTAIGITLLYISLLLGLLIYRRTHQYVDQRGTLLCIILIVLSVVSHPLLYNILLLNQTPSTETISIEAVIPLLRTADTTTELDPYQFSTYYAGNTVTRTLDTSPKNLLLIYLEGIEETFSNVATFPHLTPNLNALSQEFIHFTNIHQIPTAAYTIGGMVASQCGLPLFSSTRNELHEGMKTSFLAGATCLGDVLAQAGYTNEYIGGADSNFAGKRTFLDSHGYQTILGRDELITRPGTTLHNWGVYDDIVFEVFTERFTELSEAGNPFMLSALTLDTHPPKGYVSKRCRDAGVDQFQNEMLNAVACTDYLVGELVSYVQQSPYADTTTIVLLSDHLAMRSDATPLLDKHPRTNRIIIIDNDVAPAQFDSYGTTIDVSTTILPYIGFTGRIGLGYDLTDETLVPLRQAVTVLHTNWFYDVIELWNPPIFTDVITIQTDMHELTIGAETYSFPAFINFTPEWESAITFRYTLPEETLLSYPEKMEPYKTYLLIEECQLLAPASTTTATYCLGYGSNNRITTIEPLTKSWYTLTKDAFIKKAYAP